MYTYSYPYNKKRMPKRRDRKRRMIPLNIGTVVFGILFVYIIIVLGVYLTTSKVRTYVVTSGPLAKNSTYTGMVFCNEEIVTADAAGYVSYYVKENDMVRKGGIVYGTSPEKTISGNVAPSDKASAEAGQIIKDFAVHYDPLDHQDVYSLKFRLEGLLVRDAAGVNDQNYSSVTIGNQTVSRSKSDGLICFRQDGYESLQPSDITKDLFNKRGYSFEDLKKQDTVRQGDPVYKLVDAEDWDLVIPLDSASYVRLADTKVIRVRFIKDDVCQNASISLFDDKDGNHYADLSFSGGLIRYLGERYLDIELASNTMIGLKIPVTSIVNKNFYTVPEAYGKSMNNSDEVCFYLMRSENGTEKVEPVVTTIYEKKDGLYYLDPGSFSDGDIIVMENSSTDRYVIHNTGTLEGVYCVNKGYTVFRKIAILDKNENYCIVQKNISYGISQYDTIVLDASKVRESQIAT